MCHVISYILVRTISLVRCKHPCTCSVSVLSSGAIVIFVIIDRAMALIMLYIVMYLFLQSDLVKNGVFRAVLYILSIIFR